MLGHTQTAMTDRYVRAAASVRGGHFGEPFPALPAIGANRHRIVSDDFGLPMLPESHGYLRGGRDSNPAKLLNSRLFDVVSRGADGTRVDVSAREPVAIGPSTAAVEGPVECALATALARAAEAARWDVVAQLAHELEARRLADWGNVVQFQPSRNKDDAK